MNANLSGPTQNRLIARAKEHGGPTPMPVDQAERQCVFRLKRRGLVDVSFDFKHYWIKAGARVDPKPDLLERLQRGPLCSDDWKEVAASRKSLTVRIHKLRQAGHKIESVPVERDARSVPPVIYKLVD